VVGLNRFFGILLPVLSRLCNAVSNSAISHPEIAKKASKFRWSELQLHKKMLVLILKVLHMQNTMEQQVRARSLSLSFLLSLSLFL